MDKRGNPNRPQQAARGGPNQTPQITGAPRHLIGENLDRPNSPDPRFRGDPNYQGDPWFRGMNADTGLADRQYDDTTGLAPLTTRGAAPIGRIV